MKSTIVTPINTEFVTDAESEIEIENAAPKVVYYLFDPKTFAYSRSVEASVQPEHSSVWSPPACGPGIEAYWAGEYWVRCLSTGSITVELRRQLCVDELQQQLKTDLADLDQSTATEESATYLQQFNDAQVYHRGGEASVFLMTLADVREIPLDTLVETILRKAKTYHIAQATLLGQYQNAIQRIANTEPEWTQQMLTQRRFQRPA